MPDTGHDAKITLLVLSLVIGAGLFWYGVINWLIPWMHAVYDTVILQ